MTGGRILLVDLGNTSLKWSVLKEESREPPSCRPHRRVALDSVLDESWSGLERPSRVLLASVGPEGVRKSLIDWVAGNWQLSVDLQTSRSVAHGVTLAYADPRRFGVDRWLALIAARRRYSEPVCVMDCGTALTIDVLDRDGRHLGGLILPGMRMMREALSERTGIGLRESDESTELLACDTEAAVSCGVLSACVATAEHVVRRLQSSLGALPLIMVTGGDGRKVQSQLDLESSYQPDLVMEGLAIVAGEQRT